MARTTRTDSRMPRSPLEPNLREGGRERERGEREREEERERGRERGERERERALFGLGFRVSGVGFMGFGGAEGGT